MPRAHLVPGRHRRKARRRACCRLRRRAALTFLRCIDHHALPARQLAPPFLASFFWQALPPRQRVGCSLAYMVYRKTGAVALGDANSSLSRKTDTFIKLPRYTRQSEPVLSTGSELTTHRNGEHGIRRKVYSDYQFIQKGRRSTRTNNLGSNAPPCIIR